MKSYALIAAAMILAPMAALADHSSATASMEEACTISANLTVGSRGDAVTCLQAHLIEEGLLGISAATGYFGEMTKSAVVQWQKVHGVPQTGFFGTLSRAAWTGGAMDASAHAPASSMSSDSMSMTAMESHDDHEALDASSWPSAPSVSMVLHPDTMSGYNLEIIPVNFRFAPEHVNTTALQNEGHAHVYIDGKKIARVYGPWLHLPKELFSAGAHTVRVTLNANDHRELSLNGAIVEAQQSVTTQ